MGDHYTILYTLYMFQILHNKKFKKDNSTCFYLQRPFKKLLSPSVSWGMENSLFLRFSKKEKKNWKISYMYEPVSIDILVFHIQFLHSITVLSKPLAAFGTFNLICYFKRINRFFFLMPVLDTCHLFVIIDFRFSFSYFWKLLGIISSHLLTRLFYASVDLSVGGLWIMSTFRDTDQPCYPILMTESCWPPHCRIL